MRLRSVLPFLFAVLTVAVVSTDAMAMLHPRLGRYMQRDPSGTALQPTTSPARNVAASAYTQRDRLPAGQYHDGMSLYQYVRGNALKYADPSGLLAKTCRSGETAVPRPGFKPEDNGCGPGTGLLNLLIPDEPEGFDFRPACTNHDICYQTCGETQWDCDNDFHKDLVKICEGQKWWIRRRKCMIIAEIYAAAVMGHGEGSHSEGQEEACACRCDATGAIRPGS